MILKKNPQRGRSDALPAPWLRWVAVFCMVLTGVASTVQVCHTHENRRATAGVDGSGLVHERSGLDAGASRAPERKDSVPDSSVRCPLCLAMHAAIPVVRSLPQVALVPVARAAAPMERLGRMFSWRFEMASRPPPAGAFFA